MVCDQLKGFLKYLIWVIFSFSVYGEGIPVPKLDVVRVLERDTQKVLETIVLSYEKEGVQLDLVGAVHLADASYYDALNDRFDQYEAVLFEMIGDGKPPKPSKKKKQVLVGESKTEMDVVSQMYSLYENMLGLELQRDGIDYDKPQFIHADLSHQEFTNLQKQKGETVMKFALENTNMEFFENIDQATMLGAMLTGDSTALKHQFIDFLGNSDDSLSEKEDSSVIIRARNEKCLSVLEKKLKQQQGLKKVAVFYGAAHFPDFHQQLTEKGWEKIGEEWLTAWKVKNND